MQIWQHSAMRNSFPCPMHYLWALNFAWHHIATVHPSGKCYYLTNLNNSASFGKVAASLRNSLSRSSVPVCLLCTALEGSCCHLWPWGKLTIDFHIIASWFLDIFAVWEYLVSQYRIILCLQSMDTWVKVTVFQWLREPWQIRWWVQPHWTAVTVTSTPHL